MIQVEEKRNSYFVSCFITYKDGNFGFGNFEIGVSGKIDNLDDVQLLEKMIKERNEKIKAVTIINFKLFDWR